MEAAPQDQQEQHEDMASVLKKTFGPNYYGDSEASDPMLTRATKDGAITLDEFHELLIDARDAEQDSKETHPQTEAKPQASEVEQNTTPFSLTKEEEQAGAELDAAYKQLFSDIDSLSKLKSQDIDQLAGGDKAKATMLRTQIDQAEQELKARARELDSVTETIRKEAGHRVQESIKAFISGENEKLESQMPGIDRKAVKKYLINSGFPEGEVSAITNHQIILLAEKARRWDAMQADKPQKGKFIPAIQNGVIVNKPAPGSFKDSREEVAVKRFLKGGASVDDMLAFNNFEERTGFDRYAGYKDRQEYEAVQRVVKKQNPKIEDILEHQNWQQRQQKRQRGKRA